MTWPSSNSSSSTGSSSAIEADGTSMGGGLQPNDKDVYNENPKSSEFDTVKCQTRLTKPFGNVSKTESSSIPQLAKSTCTATSLSRWAFVVSICFSASQQLDHCQGSFTAGIHFDLVIDEHSPFGALNAQMGQI